MKKSSHVNALGAPDQVAPSDKIGWVGDQAKAATGANNIKDFGAAGDGNTLDTQAINKTIEACSAAGGGTLLFPAGAYLTGTVHLKSNLTLCLGAGATILGSKNLKDYEDILDPERKRARQWHAALAERHDLRNVAITGRGTIDGHKVSNPGGEENRRGPHAIFFSNCEGSRSRTSSSQTPATRASDGGLFQRQPARRDGHRWLGWHRPVRLQVFYHH